MSHYVLQEAFLPPCIVDFPWPIWAAWCKEHCVHLVGKAIDSLNEGRLAREALRKGEDLLRDFGAEMADAAFFHRLAQAGGPHHISLGTLEIETLAWNR